MFNQINQINQFNQTKYLFRPTLTQIEAAEGKRATEEDHPVAFPTPQEALPRDLDLGLDLKWTQKKQQIWMTAKGESNRGEPIRTDLLLITDPTVKNLEEETEETEETGAITEDLKRFSSPVSEIGYTPGKILSFIKAQDLIETSLQRRTTTMWQSIKRIKNTNSIKSTSLSLGSLRDMTPVKSSIGKLCRLVSQRPRQRTLKLL